MNALVCNGLGDWFVIDSLLTETEKKALSVVWLAGQSALFVRDAINLAYPRVKVQLLDHLNTYGSATNVQRRFPHVPKDAIDLSIHTVFPSLRDFQGSSYERVVMERDRYELPEKYYAIQDRSCYKNEKRNYTKDDWKRAKEFLYQQQAQGVLLYHEKIEKIPEGIIDWTGSTLQNSIAVIKYSQGFIGVDSSMSILAAKLNKQVFIKTYGDWFTKWQGRYMENAKGYNIVWA